MVNEEIGFVFSFVRHMSLDEEMRYRIAAVDTFVKGEVHMCLLFVNVICKCMLRGANRRKGKVRYMSKS